MPTLVTLPTHRAPALCATTTLAQLAQAGALFDSPEPTEERFRETLDEIYGDAALLQYAIWDQRGTGEVASCQFRLKDQSVLQFDETLCCRMLWLALDWDLDSKGQAWGDRGKRGLSADNVREYIENHPQLSTCKAWYFSYSGVRVLFQLKIPFDIKTLDDVARWRRGYATFVDSLGDPPSGEFEKKARTHPFALWRVPHYICDGRDTSNREIIYPETSQPLDLVFDPVEPSPQRSTGVVYDQVDSQDARRLLWSHPLIKHLRENRVALSYSDWRALGTNIYALLGDAGESVFREVSAWDAKSDPRSVGPCWLGIMRSADEGYGPIRWGNFDFPVESLFQNPPAPTSSLAAAVRRKARALNPPPTPPQELDEGVPLRHNPAPSGSNADEVKELLRTTVTQLKDGTEKTKVKKDLKNLEIILQNDNRWRGLLRRNHLGAIDLYGDERIVDEHITQWRSMTAVSYGLAYSKDDFWEGVKLECWRNEFHPVFDYLMPLKWDGVDRYPELARRMGDSDPFTATLLKKFFISGVVRPLEWLNRSPNVNLKVDTCLILQGKQGYRKSSFFRALVPLPELFSDSLPNIQSERKDAALHMMGRWIIEQAEFEGHVARSSIETMKAFISREREDFRKAYGRAEIHMRRPSILVGSTNSDQFLNDPTGDRRFWVISLGSQKIDYRWVVENRDQLWAQAVELYAKREQWWLTDQESELNSLRNDRFRRLESYKELVDEYLATNPILPFLKESEDYVEKLGFTMRGLTQFALEKKMIEVTPALLSKISIYVGRLGWARCRVSVNKARVWCYRKERNNMAI